MVSPLVTAFLQKDVNSRVKSSASLTRCRGSWAGSGGIGQSLMLTFPK